MRICLLVWHSLRNRIVFEKVFFPLQPSCGFHQQLCSHMERADPQLWVPLCSEAKQLKVRQKATGRERRAGWSGGLACFGKIWNLFGGGVKSFSLSWCFPSGLMGTRAVSHPVKRWTNLRAGKPKEALQAASLLVLLQNVKDKLLPWSRHSWADGSADCKHSFCDCIMLCSGAQQSRGSSQAGFFLFFFCAWWSSVYLR